MSIESATVHWQRLGHLAPRTLAIEKRDAQGAAQPRNEFAVADRPSLLLQSSEPLRVGPGHRSVEQISRKNQRRPFAIKSARGAEVSAIGTYIVRPRP